MRKVIRDTLRNQRKIAKIKQLPKIYIIGRWARYGVREYYFTGKYTTIDGVSIPLVYNYDDCNGTDSLWRLLPITYVTSGCVLLWTQHEEVACSVARLCNGQKQVHIMTEIEVVLIVLLSLILLGAILTGAFPLMVKRYRNHTRRRNKTDLQRRSYLK